MIKMISILFLLLSAFSSSLLSESIAITGAKIHTMTGPVLEKGTILIRDGKIEAVGAVVQIPAGYRTIDASGKNVYPGFIDGNCHVGLTEISQVASTVDESESVDPVTPQMKVTDAFFPESFAIGVTRSNGVTACIVSPGDVNVFSGMSAFIEFSGKQIDQVVLKSATGLHVTLGEAPKARYGNQNKQPSTRMGTAALLRQTLIQAKEYQSKQERYDRKQKEKKKDSTESQPPERNLKLEAVLEVLEGRIPLVVSAHRVDDILTAIRIAEEFGIKNNLVLNHGTNAHKIAGILAREKIPVIVGPVTTQPDSMETIGASYETAALLHRAGVLIAIQSNEVHNARNLPYEAGLAVAHGLPYEEALKAITVNVARIFRVNDIGTLEAGKRANLIIAEGDPLEPRTRVTHVFIGGELITEGNYHEQLWEGTAK